MKVWQLWAAFWLMLALSGATCVTLAVKVVPVATNLQTFLDGQEWVGVHSPMRTRFVDRHGEEHEVITFRGEYDPNESADQHVARHFADRDRMRKEANK